MDIKNRLWACEVDLGGSGSGAVTSFVNKIKKFGVHNCGVLFYQLDDFQILKDSAPRSQSVNQLVNKLVS
jgi:hypothetical protein